MDRCKSYTPNRRYTRAPTSSRACAECDASAFALRTAWQKTAGGRVESHGRFQIMHPQGGAESKALRALLGRKKPSGGAHEDPQVSRHWSWRVGDPHLDAQIGVQGDGARGTCSRQLLSPNDVEGARRGDEHAAYVGLATSSRLRPGGVAGKGDRCAARARRRSTPVDRRRGAPTTGRGDQVGGAGLAQAASSARRHLH